MMSSKAWQLGTPETGIYKFYDWLRNRLNFKLADYLDTTGLQREDSIVLEAGSGPAFASSILAKHPNVGLSVAADIDLEALQEARLRDTSLTLVVADLNYLPFRSESIDLCWNSSTIEHLPNPQSALNEMVRITKTGGTVFVGVPNVFGPLGIQRLMKNTSAGIWIGETFSFRGLKGMLIQSGLKPQSHIYYFFRFFVGIVGKK
jgi:ubiquinone/menaquinone biosynthesis C-methylase UbiE